MLLRLKVWLSGLCVVSTFLAVAQRSYSPTSVLASGAWFQLSTQQSGIYKIDLAFLSKLGINTSNLSSSSIRVFGNGGRMLGEACAATRTDDLQEIAIRVEDGGDQVFNGSDFLLFYSTGPDTWAKDSVNQQFNHQKNLYSNRSYYFLTVGGTGLRIPDLSIPGNPPTTVTSFSGRFFHELDSVNFLASGKGWYGEEFSDAPGKVLSRRFSFQDPGFIPGSQAALKANCISRSVNTASRFDIRVNGGAVNSLSIAATGAGLYDPFGKENQGLFPVTMTGTETVIDFTYAPGSFNAQGWLNWFEIMGRSALAMNGSSQLSFRDWQSISAGNASFIVSGAANDIRVWDVTTESLPVQMTGTLTSGQFQFNNDCSRLREYVAVQGSAFLIPGAVGRIAIQDLHKTDPVDMIIVTHGPFQAQAERLAVLHQQRDGLRVRVVTPQQIYNEFSSGIADPVAIRDFVKMYHDRYSANLPDRLRYLLLFGDASYDYKDKLINNTNFVPAYQSNVSLDILSTYTSDDFFGFLDDNEDINSGAVANTLDIGIGRVPARNPEEVKNFVDKIENYFATESFGPWRNNLTFIADDEDQNLHVQDAEIITTTATTTAPVFEQQKIYLDAYRQESGVSGSSYPEVNQQINNKVFNGTLLWNFTGHGGPRRLAEETILDQEIVNTWTNTYRLPLFVTATCDFAPYDNPLQPSLGENLLLRPKSGAIALMTTTRIVFSFSNRVMNNNYVHYALQRDANGQYRTLGEAVKDAKNFTYLNSGDIINNRKFTLLGDPALRIAFPELYVRPVRINGIPVAQVDTLSAGEKIIIEGEVTDAAGNLLNSFNGTAYPSVFDKPQTTNTLGNDPASPITTFTTQTSALFKGKVSVTAGKFSFTFKVPRDINYQVGNGRMSLYADNGNVDGNGVFTNFKVGGTGVVVDDDKDGPEIEAYLNDERFVNGGISNENPVLLLKLADSSGINTAGTGIGHDLMATLDGDNTKYFILNDYYQGELDSYQKGAVKFQLPELEPGQHTLKIKAWDVVNNSSEAVLDFTIEKDETLSLTRVLNYPNPFTTHTSFWFEHNKPGRDLYVRLQIFTLTGRVIKVIQKTINTAGNRSNDLEWDGRDEFGDKIGRGVYLYKLSVTTPEKERKEKIEKLVIF